MGNDQSRTAGNPEKDDEKCPETIEKSHALLWGCKTAEEHKFRKALLIQILRPLKGEQGLIASGMEYRSVTLQEDGNLVTPTAEFANTTIPAPIRNVSSIDSCECSNAGELEEEKKEENPCHRCRPLVYVKTNQEQQSPKRQGNDQHPCTHHHRRMTRLFHKESNTMITAKNRKEFIADGAMYDIITRLTMEYAHEVMMREGQMEWVTIPHEQTETATEPTSTTQPIQALVSTRLLEDESRLDSEPTLVIVTGRGHVRAGVFSRQHLLTSGLELGSAVPFVLEAHKRKINLIVLDPNAHGDRVGMVTFEKSMKHIFRRWESEEDEKVEKAGLDDSIPTEKPNKNLYVLSHSQSGAQLVRYLLKRSEYYLPRICAIAFTDSTHNIQWTKRNNQEGLKSLLESDECIYFKRSEETIEHALDPLSTIGQTVDTDDFWKHRFGEINTRCAGTSDHSLTNWFARDHIWDHFDQAMVTNKNTT